MQHDTHSNTAEHPVWHGKFASYVFGFCLSIILTLVAYFAVANNLLPPQKLIPAVIALGTLQVIAQLLFFLHLGKESRPRWNLVFFLFMFMVVVIVVVGSLWIMDNLDYRVMPPMETHATMNHENMQS